MEPLCVVPVIPNELKDQLYEEAVEWLEKRPYISLPLSEENQSNNHERLQFSLPKQPSEDEYDWREIEEASSQDILNDFYDPELKPYIIKLGSPIAQLPPVPDILKNYVSDIVYRGPEEADAEIYDVKKVKVPFVFKRFVSGNSSRCLAFSNMEISHFMATLFHYIEAAAQQYSHVNLKSFDLYHGHMFVHAQATPTVDDKNPSNVLVNTDLGILFHSKEFPEDYATVPIGHARMGGIFDVRHGTTQKSSDPDFHLRNYVWLLSTNTVYLLDPKAATYPASKLPFQEKYFTVNERSFSEFNIGNINYFPGANTNRDHPIHQMPCIIQTDDEYWKAVYRFERYHFVKESSLIHLDVYSSPVFAFSPTLKLKHAFRHLEDFIKQFSKQDLIDFVSVKKNESLLTKGETNFVAKQRIPPVKHRSLIPEASLALIVQLMELRIARLDTELHDHNEQQLLQLTQQKVNEEHARDALDRTKGDGGQYSAFRAQHLLSAAFSEYRTPEDLSSYGNVDYGIEEALPFVTALYYGDYALEALQMAHQPNQSLSFEDIVAAVTKKRQDLAHELLQKEVKTKLL